MKTLRYVLIFCIGAWATAAVAQDTPDLSGTWVLDTKRGENLGMMAALEQTLVVTQNAETVTLDFTNVFRGSESTRQVTLVLSGASVDNVGGMGDPGKTVTTWDGDRLVTVWTTPSAIPGNEVKRTETHALSDDGATLTVTSERANRPMMTMVYGKQ